MAETTMNFRIDEDLKRAFEAAAKEQDMTASQLIRRYIRMEVDKYMRQNSQKELLTHEKRKDGGKASARRKKQPSASGIPLLDGLMKKGGV